MSSSIIGEVSKRCNLPEEIVRQVLTEEMLVAAEKLMKGERVVLYGRCTMSPKIAEYNYSNSDKTHKVMKIRCKPSATILNILDGLSYKAEKDNIELNIKDTSNGIIRVDSL